jgi:hypothetical protein
VARGSAPATIYILNFPPGLLTSTSVLNEAWVELTNYGSDLRGQLAGVHLVELRGLLLWMLGLLLISNNDITPSHGMKFGPAHSPRA